MEIIYRKIKPEDNQQICNVIRTVLEEYGGKKPGTAYYDKDTENMFEAYQESGAIYYVAEINGKVVSGCGIKHLSGVTENIAELQKLYLLKEYRGLGIGKKLVEMCLNFAKNFGYEAVYLETFENMKAAQGLYKKYGFNYINQRMGGTGHSSCPVFMLKKFKE